MLKFLKCLLSWKVENLTNSDNLKITTQSIAPQKNKTVSGIVTNVFPHLKLTIVTIEGKV